MSILWALPVVVVAMGGWVAVTSVREMSAEIDRLSSTVARFGQLQPAVAQVLNDAELVHRRAGLLRRR
ncbi:MAG TPA: hypothetical protein VGA13_11365 [Acidimicrobiales bacterium]